MKETDAQLLLCELLQHAIQERFQYRHKWKQQNLIEKQLQLFQKIN